MIWLALGICALGVVAFIAAGALAHKAFGGTRR